MAQLVKNSPATRETWVQSLSWEDPWRKERLPTPVFWPGEFNGLYSPWGHKVLYKAVTRVNGDDGTCATSRGVSRFKLSDRVCVTVLAVKCHCFSPLAPPGALCCWGWDCTNPLSPLPVAPCSSCQLAAVLEQGKQDTWTGSGRRYRYRSKLYLHTPRPNAHRGSD